MMYTLEFNILENLNPKINCLQETLKPKTIEIRSQIHHIDILPCAIQGMKPQCYMYFEICNTENCDKYGKSCYK